MEEPILCSPDEANKRNQATVVHADFHGPSPRGTDGSVLLPDEEHPYSRTKRTGKQNLEHLELFHPHSVLFCVAAVQII